ncbi:magnesium-translocating P-type ATPase [Streptomyces sp. NPDC058864]
MAWPEAAAPEAYRPSLPGVTPTALADLTELQVLRHLETGPRGLTEREAQQRLAAGENALPLATSRPWTVRLLTALRDPFTIVLCSLALVSSLTGARGTTLVIAILVGASAVLRLAGEHRADKAAAALRALVASTATVLRRADDDSVPLPRDIPLSQLVAGDIVKLSPGDVVPADLRLLKSHNLTVNQAPLTGESAPVRKDLQAVRGPTTAGFGLPHLCFLGSSVVSGSASAVVVATGRDTSFASTHQPAHVTRPPTAFDRTARSTALALVRFMLATVPLVLAAGAILHGRGWDTLPFAVAVAVGLTPEMLPVVITTALARGASVLRHHQVVIKRLPALHELGAMDVLCVDKTGTLTRDRLVVDRAVDPHGNPDPAVLRWAITASLASAELADLPVLDAFDEALLDAAEDFDEPFNQSVTAVEVIPFDPVRRRSTAVVRRSARPGQHTLIVTGAPEHVLDRCQGMELDERARILRLVEDHSAEGLRVLAVALAERPARTRPYTAGDESGLTLTGFIGLHDEPEPSAARALSDLGAHGVTVKIVTGDHPATAVRACQDVGIEPRRVIPAHTIDALDDRALARLAESTTVFARATPQHKARIVRALSQAGHTTGFLGDGINDIPALRAADIGICPHSAVDAARETADTVLAAKDLAAISHAVRTGRRSLANIGNYLRVTLSANVGNVLAMLTAGALLPFLPMLPSQVLVQNLCFDAAQLALAFDRPRPSRTPPPSALNRAALAKFAIRFGLINAAADLTTFAMIGWLTHGFTTPHAQSFFHAGWFTENLLTQALTVHVLRSPSRGDRTPAPWPLRLANLALAAVGLLVPFSPVAPVLGMSSLPAAYYPGLALILSTYACCLLLVRNRGLRHKDRPLPTEKAIV